MILPNAVTRDFLFRTDINSLLRGLNAILGIGQISRTHLRSLRVDEEGHMYTASTQFDLIKFAFIVNEKSIKEKTLLDENRAVYYDDEDNSHKFLNELTGDNKEALFIKEQVNCVTYLKSLFRSDVLREESIHLYQNLLSAILDGYQTNSGIIYFLHLNEITFIINRGLTPDPKTDYTRFFFYSRIYEIPPKSKLQEANFIQVNRHKLEIDGFENSSESDLSQMVIPVVHLHPYSES